ncbi:hypothetical protein EDB92DRAFT_1946396 [Lactarius akahatsu]|uniref:Uncharacterized protein n=1 Tax=Lactarius akahatsu TaxID=416441 RepID=A0AAD4LKU7_9AGAM|nr:hypothetical protein EDB92DRAFT_1946396 [Lactarius akahatsu]
MAVLVRSRDEDISALESGDTVLEILFALFAIRTKIRTPLRSRMTNEIHFYQLSEKGVDELVDELTPEPLGAPLTQEGQRDLASAPVVFGANGPWPKLANTGKHVLNLASYNFTGLAGDETSKVRAIETLRKYGVGTDASIPYLQGFSQKSCVVSAFSILQSVVDTIVADRGIFDHNDLKSLDDLFLSVEKERWDVSDLLQDDSLLSRASLRRTPPWSIYQNWQKHKYKYRFILVESISI